MGAGRGRGRTGDRDHQQLWMGSWSWNGLAALLGTFDAPLTDVQPAELRQACAVLADRYGQVS